jgi:hypothetical protein
VSKAPLPPADDVRFWGNVYWRHVQSAVERAERGGAPLVTGRGGKGVVEFGRRSVREIQWRMQAQRTNYGKGGPTPWLRRRALAREARLFEKRVGWRRGCLDLADNFAKVCHALAAVEPVDFRRGRRQGKASRYLLMAMVDLAPLHDDKFLFARSGANKLSPGRALICNRAASLARHDGVSLNTKKLAKEFSVLVARRNSAAKQPTPTNVLALWLGAADTAK